MKVLIYTTRKINLCIHIFMTCTVYFRPTYKILQPKRKLLISRDP